MQEMRNSFWYLFAKNYQHRTWFDRIIEKIKRVQFFGLACIHASMLSATSV